MKNKKECWLLSVCVESRTFQSPLLPLPQVALAQSCSIGHMSLDYSLLKRAPNCLPELYPTARGDFL
jgi:hypothetical protein